MKLKKIVAAAAAAVMSLAMLTACSGGGGGSAAAGTGWTRQEVSVEDNWGEISDADKEVSYYTSDGKWVYEKYTDSEGTDESLIKVDGSEWYTVNTASNPWKAYKEEKIPASSAVIESTVEGVGEYKGTNYKTIVITATLSNGRKTTTTEYYDITKGTLKYIKSETTTGSGKVVYTITRVEIDKAEVDSANVDKLNLENYDIVGSYKDLGLPEE